MQSLHDLQCGCLCVQLQLAEIEELRQREANMTALAAIGPRKQRRLDTSSSVVIRLTFCQESL